jgi:hypothetical protein
LNNTNSPALTKFENNSTKKGTCQENSNSLVLFALSENCTHTLSNGPIIYLLFNVKCRETLIFTNLMRAHANTVRGNMTFRRWSSVQFFFKYNSKKEKNNAVPFHLNLKKSKLCARGTFMASLLYKRRAMGDKAAGRETRYEKDTRRLLIPPHYRVHKYLSLSASRRICQMPTNGAFFD